MTAATYHDLALEWRPQRSSDKKFNVLAIVVLLVLLAIAFVMSSIDVPKEERQVRVIPERIAQFVMEKEKPKPPPPKPKLEPPKPKPKPEVKKLPPKKQEVQKPLTETQKKAREKAADSGLLALSNDLADLMDTSEVSAMVGGKLNKNSGAGQQAASVNKQLLTADAGKGSGGVDSGQYTTSISSTRLSQREITQVKQSLAASGSAKKDKSSSARSGNVRAEEDVTIVFDQNKSKLYSIYNRARRTNPGLKGKIVLEITILPSGKVSEVRIVSSELNDKKLESRLVSRIKLFNFGARDVKTVTVTYPIEFLPS